MTNADDRFFANVGQSSLPIQTVAARPARDIEPQTDYLVVLPRKGTDLKTCQYYPAPISS